MRRRSRPNLQGLVCQSMLGPKHRIYLLDWSKRDSLRLSRWTGSTSFRRGPRRGEKRKFWCVAIVGVLEAERLMSELGEEALLAVSWSVPSKVAAIARWDSWQCGCGERGIEDGFLWRSRK